MSAADSYSETVRGYRSVTVPLSCAAGTSTNAKTAHASVNSHYSEAISTGSATPGTLRAWSIVDVVRSDTRGTGSAQASATVSFTDVIFIDSNGDPELTDPTASLRPQEGVSGNVFSRPAIPGGAGYTCFLWIFACDPSRPFVLAAQFAQLSALYFLTDSRNSRPQTASARALRPCTAARA